MAQSPFPCPICRSYHDKLLAYINFGLTDSFFKSLAAGGKGSDGGRKRASRTVKVAALYFLLFEQAETAVVVQYIAHCIAG